MSWHGAVIFYRTLNVSSGSGAHSAQKENEDNPSGSTIKEDDINTLFFDHLLNNDMTQDILAVCSLLDAILARLKIELPHVTSFYLLSEKARCYQNDFLPVMATHIAKSHGLSIQSLLRSETQRGKSLVDAHFAIAMKHISRYCNETMNDVTTPYDVVDALNSCGVANCTTEMVHMRRDYAPLWKWISAHSEGRLAKLGRINEFVYEQPAVADKKWKVKCYALSNRGFATYEFGKHYSKPVEGTTQCEPTTIDDVELPGRGGNPSMMAGREAADGRPVVKATRGSPKEGQEG